LDHFIEDQVAILAKAMSGDMAAQKSIFTHFYAYVISLTLRYMASREEAEEMLNDTFLKVFDRLDKYDAAHPFKGWLRKIAINTCIDRIRSLRRLPSFKELSLLAQTPSDDDEMIWDQNEEVLPILQELPPKYRAVFNLYVFDEYKHKEIANLLGISEGTSKSNYSRAKEILKKRLVKIKQQDPAVNMSYALKSERY
jgi:RNA polymerase sigma-70 factor (ECF subfamily)